MMFLQGCNLLGPEGVTTRAARTMFVKVNLDDELFEQSDSDNDATELVFEETPLIAAGGNHASSQHHQRTEHQRELELDGQRRRQSRRHRRGRLHQASDCSQSMLSRSSCAAMVCGTG